MPLFKKSSSGAGSLFDVHRKALHQCRSIFLKSLDLSRATDYLSPQDSNHLLASDSHENASGMATHEEQIAQFLDSVEMGGQKSFGVFLDYLKENQRHLHLVLEETIQNIANLHNNNDPSGKAAAEGDLDRDVVMSGETVRRLLQHKKNKSRMTNSNPNGSESTHNLNTKGDDDNNDDDGGAHHYIDCYTVTTRGRQRTEHWMKHDKTPRTDTGHNDKQMTMCVLTSDTHFQRINLSSDDWSAIPGGVRIPPKKCDVYIYKKTRGHHLLESGSKHTNGDRAQQSEIMFGRSVGSGGHAGGHGAVRSQLPPPVPPKPSYLPLMGLNSGMARVRRVEVENASQVVKLTAPKRPLPLILPEPPTVNCRSNESTLSSSNGTDQGEEKKTPVANGNQDDRVKREGRVEERGEDADCCLDYNVSLCSASDLAFDPVQKEELSCESYEPIDTPIREEPLPLDSLLSPLPTYSTVDLEKKTSRKAIGVETGEELGAEVLTPEVGQIVVTRKEEETARVAEKSPVDSLSDEALPVSKELDAKWNESAKGLVAALIAADPPLPEKQLPSFVLHNDDDEEEEDSSGSNSYYEDIDVHCHDPLTSSTSAGIDIYLNPQVRQRTLSQRRKQQTKVLDEVETPSCKLILKGSFLIAEVEDACCSDIQPSETCVQSSELNNSQPTRCSSIKSTVQSEINSTKLNNHPNGPDVQIDTMADEPSAKLVGHDHSANHVLLEQFRGTRLAYDKEGHALYVPVFLLKRYGEPDKEAWFYPLELTSRQAALFLRTEKLEGCFVVYRSPFRSAEVAYNLSICLDSGEVVHYHVVENIHGDVMIEGHDHAFMSIIDLVDYFSQNKASLATRLRRPLKYARLPISPGFHYDCRYELQRKELSLTGNIIGQGNFGVVCSGVYRNQPVAVKVLQQTEGTVTDEDDFLEEAKSLMGLSHEHIVRLVGVSCTARPFFIVTEFAAKGSVKECLRNERISLNSLEVLFNISIQMVSAMTYLESLRFLIHRDLASRNFLLADDSCVKLADFGRARFVTDDWFEAPSKERICIKWAAPEVLIDSHYSTKSDVWAMGVVLWEVFSRAERPYAALPGEQTAIYVVEGGRLDRPHSCPPDIYRIMRSCWKEDPRDRPTFRELYKKLCNKSSLCCAPVESSQSQKQTLTVSDSSQSMSSKPSTPSATAKLRLIHSNGKKASRLGSPKEEERRNSAEQRSLGYRNRTGTSSSEASVASGNGLLDVDREEDLTRGDRIRKSLRKLMKITTTKTKSDSKADVAMAAKTPTGGRGGHDDSRADELRP